MSERGRPVRVLHVLYDLERGGVQSWLRTTLAGGAGSPWQFDFAVSSLERDELRPELERLGARVFACPRPSRSLAYVRDLTRILVDEGPYDVVHSHFDPAFLPLVAARRAGVPMRIAHSHRGCRELAPLPSFLRVGLTPLVRHLTSRYATHRIACSDRAGVAMFGHAAVRRGDVSFLREGVRVSDFRVDSIPGSIDLEPCGRPVVLHVGRFAPEKNHEFLLEIFGEILKAQPGAELWLAGDGPLQPGVRGRVSTLGLADRVRFLGTRRDVASLYASADVLLLPSRFEGLPLTAVEAQASGLPVVLATTITRQVTACPDLVHWCSLNASSASWAATAVNSMARARRTREADVRAAGFDISESNRRLDELYGARHDVRERRRAIG